MEETLLKEIKTTFNELNDIIFAFDEERLNVVPFEGSWTAAQVAEHIIKSLSGLKDLLNGPTEKADRQPDEKVKAVRDLFLNFTIKMKSPEFILPGNSPHTKDELSTSLKNLEQDMIGALELDLTQVCTAFELPTFGKFTRLEWINFYLVHTERHTQQLKNIFRSLKQTTVS
jgi:hypothetical protein